MGRGVVALTASMRAASASFTTSGDPSTVAVPWPSVAEGAQVMSLVSPQPHFETNFATKHRCSYWFGG
jgi:para-nitrobenzyl esterase